MMETELSHKSVTGGTCHTGVGTITMVRHTGSDESIAQVAREQPHHAERAALATPELLNYLIQRRHMSALETAKVEFTLCLPAELLGPWSEGESGPLGEMDSAFKNSGEAVSLEPCDEEGRLKLRVNGDLRGLLHYMEVRSRREVSDEARALTATLFDELSQRYPLTMRAWNDHIHRAVSFNQREQRALAGLLRGALGGDSEAVVGAWVATHYSAGELAQEEELRHKLRRILEADHALPTGCGE